MLARTLVLLLLASLLGCATATAPEVKPREHQSPRGLYSLELSRSFRQSLPPNDSYDSFYSWRARDWIVGVIVDGPPEDLHQLDEAVRMNALSSEIEAELVHVRDVDLSGLVARRSELILRVDGQKLLMLNTHTATSDNNVQLIVSGPLDDARGLRELMQGLEQGAFRFREGIGGLVATPPYDLTDPDLPVRFTQEPAAWTSARRGSLSAEAFLELRVPDEDLWFMAFLEVLDDELLAEAEAGPAFFEGVAERMHGAMADGLAAVPPGDLRAFDAQGAAPDKRWSLGGLFLADDGNVPVTYRMRLARSGSQVVRMYCWGQATQDVKGPCDALFDVITLP